MTPFLSWLAQHGLESKGHIGEFGAPDRTEWMPIVQNFVSAVNAVGLPMTVHQDEPYPNDSYTMNVFPQTDSTGTIVGADRLIIKAIM